MPPIKLEKKKVKFAVKNEYELNDDIEKIIKPRSAKSLTTMNQKVNHRIASKFKPTRLQNSSTPEPMYRIVNSSSSIQTLAKTRRNSALGPASYENALQTYRPEK